MSDIDLTAEEIRAARDILGAPDMKVVCRHVPQIWWNLSKKQVVSISSMADKTTISFTPRGRKLMKDLQIDKS